MKRDPIETSSSPSAPSGPGISSDSDAARDRKAEHLQLAADRGMQGTGGVFERYRFEHAALPEIDYQEIDLTTSFLGRTLRYPLLVSCMTGGTAEAGIKLIERLGGEIVGCAFIVDLPELGGRKLLEELGMDVHVLCEFDGA